jgi:hypothetical protein
MMNPRKALPLLLAFAPILLAAAPAKQAKGFGEWLRFHKTPKSDELQVAIGQFKHPKTGVQVDLVGAIHIGDRAYYQELNKRFGKYDAVLFELVADPKRARNPRGPNKSPVNFMQRSMQRFLNLDFQLDTINYNRPHFIHADMDPKTFAKRQRARGESMFNLMWKIMQQEMARAKKGQPVDEITPGELLIALFSKNRALEMKRLLGANMAAIENTLSTLEAGDGTVILTERNQVALKVLKKTLGDSKYKKIAIFYGAAHMPDMARRLEKEFGFRAIGSQWLPAWHMPRP